MSVKRTMSSLPSLLHRLRELMPGSRQVYWLIKNSLRTGNSWPCIDVYTDTAEIDMCTTVVGVSNNYYMTPISMCLPYSTCNSGLKTVLTTPGLLNWKNEQIMFESVPEKCIGVVKEICNNKGFYLTTIEEYCLVSLMDTDRLEKIANVALPSGFWKGSLKPIHGSLLLDSVPFDPISLNFTKIIEKYMSVAIYNLRGDPVAWSVHSPMGEIDFGYCVPLYRRRGFSSITLATLSVLIAQTGELPYVYIESTNTLAKNCATKLGGQIKNDFNIAWLKFEKQK
ncbi:uncharacterized protein LOC144353381 [Saccoglossus kowalevskii]